MPLLRISAFDTVSRRLIENVKQLDPASAELQVSCLEAQFWLLFFSQAYLHVTVSEHLHDGNCASMCLTLLGSLTLPEWCVKANSVLL